MRINGIQLELNGGRGDIGTLNDNKKKVLRLYGASLRVYLHLCEMVNRLPSSNYVDAEFLLIDLTND